LSGKSIEVAKFAYDHKRKVAIFWI